MSLHSFDPDIAARVGIAAATIYKNFVFWCQKNLANQKHIIDGYVWTYNSRRAMRELFPYLSDSQIKTALAKLVQEGLLVVGEHNKSRMDRTNWYAVAESSEWLVTSGGKSPDDWSKIANGLAKDRQPIPDSKPDGKPDGKHGLFPDQEIPCSKKKDAGAEAAFDEFWAIYPRKVKKPSALKAFKAALKKATAAQITAGAKAYADHCKKKGTEAGFIAHASSWLNDERWNDEIPGQIRPSGNGEADELEREADAEFRSGNHAQAAVLRMKAQVKRGLPPDVLMLRKELRALELTNTQHGVDLLKRAIEWAEARYVPN